MKNKLLFTLSAIAFVLVVVSCSREKDDSAGVSDDALISMVHSSDLVTVEANNSSARQQQNPTFRLRMNHIAATACNGSFHTLPAVFPANSILVKEYLDPSGAVTASDVMYKAPVDSRSEGGWLWASYDANGNNTYSSARRANSCNSCHAEGTDKVLK